MSKDRLIRPGQGNAAAAALATQKGVPETELSLKVFWPSESALPSLLPKSYAVPSGAMRRMALLPLPVKVERRT